LDIAPGGLDIELAIALMRWGIGLDIAARLGDIATRRGGWPPVSEAQTAEERGRSIAPSGLPRPAAVVYRFHLHILAKILRILAKTPLSIRRGRSEFDRFVGRLAQRDSLARGE
jgi:hypothetical protein